MKSLFAVRECDRKAADVVCQAVFRFYGNVPSYDGAYNYTARRRNDECDSVHGRRCIIQHRHRHCQQPDTGQNRCNIKQQLSESEYDNS